MTTPAFTISLCTSPSAVMNASGVVVCEPTWKVRPSSDAACRALTSSFAAFWPDTPNLRSSGMRLLIAGTATRTHSSRSRASSVASRILSSSSSPSSANERTPSS